MTVNINNIDKNYLSNDNGSKFSNIEHQNIAQDASIFSSSSAAVEENLSQEEVSILKNNQYNEEQNQTPNIQELKNEIEKTKEEQGLIGKIWDGFKNLTHIGAGSSKAEQAINDFEEGKITEEEMLKAVEGYKNGQKQCVDMAADIVSGIAAFGAFALATGAGIAASPFTGGASLGLVAAGFGVAGAAGGAVKVGIKSIDSAVGGREYDSMGYDLATGGINGMFAPITAGIGGAAGKAVAGKVGVTAIKEGGEVAVKEAIEGTIRGSLTKTLLTTNVKYLGGTTAARALALGTDMAVNGAITGAVDSGVRYVAGDSDDKSFEGFMQEVGTGTLGGLIASPVIGGGMRLAGNKIGKLTGKIANSTNMDEGEIAKNINIDIDGDGNIFSREYTEAFQKKFGKNNIPLSQNSLRETGGFLSRISNKDISQEANATLRNLKMNDPEKYAQVLQIIKNNTVIHKKTSEGVSQKYISDVIKELSDCDIKLLQNMTKNNVSLDIYDDIAAYKNVAHANASIGYTKTPVNSPFSENETIYKTKFAGRTTIKLAERGNGGKLTKTHQDGMVEILNTAESLPHEMSHAFDFNAKSQDLNLTRQDAITIADNVSNSRYIDSPSFSKEFDEAITKDIMRMGELDEISGRNYGETFDSLLKNDHFKYYLGAEGEKTGFDFYDVKARKELFAQMGSYASTGKVTNPVFQEKIEEYFPNSLKFAKNIFNSNGQKSVKYDFL